MTIDNVVLNSAPLGAFLEGKHGATNNVDSKAKQQGLTSSYFFEGYRDADHPTIAFALAYIGNHGNITPIQMFEFDVLDQLGNLSQRVIMRDCVVTGWRLNSPLPPAAGQPTYPDREFVRVESVDVEFHAGGNQEPFKKKDINS